MKRAPLRIRALVFKPKRAESQESRPAVILAPVPCVCGLAHGHTADCPVDMSADSMHRPRLPGAREGVW